MNDELPPMGLRIVLAYGTMALILASIAWFPRSRWAALLTSKVGPSLDPRGMTRHETLRAAGGYLVIAGFGLATVYLVDLFWGWIVGTDPFNDLGISAIFWLCGLAIAVGVAGALYLGIRAIFRPATLYRWIEDELSRSEFLKTYSHAGGGDPVLIVHHEAGDYEAFVVGPPPEARLLGEATRGFPWGTLSSLGRWPTLEEAEGVARTETANG